MFENIFETVNSGFAQALYEDWRRDPSSVSEEWRKLFENGVKGEAPVDEGQTRGRVDEGQTRGREDAGAPVHAPTHQRVHDNAITGPALRLLQNMEASLDVPTATSFRDVDVTVLWNARSALNAELKAKQIKLSFTHLVGWALVRAAVKYPVMTHVVHTEGDQYLRFDPDGVHLGLAVDAEGKDGKRRLMVPIIKGAQAMSFADFHTEYERLVTGARDGKLMPDAYMGGTITLTNPGTLGTVASVPRLMKGQGSIVATGAIRDVAGRRFMTITSTYDHRIIQGAESGLFLQGMDTLLQDAAFYADIADAFGATAPAALRSPAPSAPSPSTPSATLPVGAETLYHLAAAMSLVRSYRSHGYLAANLDPLGSAPKGDPALDPAPLGLTQDVMLQIPADVTRTYVGGETLADVLPRLRDAYCGTMAYEIEHIASHEERVWLRRVIETGEHRQTPSEDERRDLLADLTKVDTLERFLHKNYLGHKRFGIEGLDMLVPMLRKAVELGAEQGVTEAVLGMAHRGRLNVLCHILGRTYGTLLAEFEGGRKVEETLAPKGGTGDVKYHHGAKGTLTTRSGDVAVELMPNPSHLEAVNPVVEGSARARQTTRAGAVATHDPTPVLAILMHGDAAFAAQGVVAETFNLSKLAGYATGGTLHIITNNQVGFTTDPSDARSTDFASDLAKGFDVPIIHVNADDPEACIGAVRLAMLYRKRFTGDVVINLVGYRRHGHNEGDEPRYTQPLMYQVIDEHPSARTVYAQKLASLGIVADADAQALADTAYAQLASAQDRVRATAPKAGEGAEPDRISSLYTAITEPQTAVPANRLRPLNARLYAAPEGFAVNKKLVKQLQARTGAFDSADGALDWAHAEALAFASLLTDGVPVRLTGQDVRRGTFSQRHLVLHDAETGTKHTPMQHLPGAVASFELHNSPLSEYACLGFEYGYAVTAQNALVLWEAQFGDFVNGAEIVIDQFLIAGLAKWGQTSRLTLLLPHGYEGQGPEHSSARIERFLALGAEGNLRVANCSTPAQYFHLLRRQATHQEIRPLVVFTPKSLLRHPRAVSHPMDLSTGEFQDALMDDTMPGSPVDVTRLVFCSGKVYYDIVTADRRAQARHVAVGRIEMLYPFPTDTVRSIVRRYPNLKELVWVQEEPSNMGARKWAVPRLADATDLPVRYIARPERSSPAEGYPVAHQAEQARLVAEALA
ncbi:MAG: multifunctional oxoglutarate decarboxylase/oxoglutarate dehydrogenase thiamine pyrophosphate-binding subunit/dihydrolipoyllysine-residue succinyltransferase subunit [Gemmatimonadales bacterium]